jgi:hypothetical protein
MPHKTYRSAADFRRALEDRLQDIVKKEAVDLQRIRRQVAFDRLLARLFADGQPSKLPWALKGGYAMELRMRFARTTKDIGLTLRVAESGDRAGHALLQRLQEPGAVDVGDFFVYTVGEPIADLDAAPYGGARFPVEARVDGRTFVKFHLDVGIGDAVIEPIEVIDARDWLEFAGVPSPSIYVALLAATDFFTVEVLTLKGLVMLRRTRFYLDQSSQRSPFTLENSETFAVIKVILWRTAWPAISRS